MDEFVSEKLEEWNLSTLKDIFDGKYYANLKFFLFSPDYESVERREV